MAIVLSICALVFLAGLFSLFNILKKRIDAIENRIDQIFENEKGKQNE